jgi:hypothetical protein
MRRALPGATAWLPRGWPASAKRAETWGMRLVCPVLVVALALSGCSLSVGAGAAARIGGHPGAAGSECNGFESCDVLYRQALAQAERCHEQADNDDCEREDQDLALSYDVLHEQTELELGALRSEAQERETALAQAEQAADAAQLDVKTDCSGPGRAPGPAASARHGNGWFEADPSAAH